MSRAFASVLAVSSDVHGGPLARQVHHWSADVFVAAVCLRLLRTFFRGRFSGRALRNWLVWAGLLPLGMLAAYAGTLLPDDGLSGGSLSVITGVLQSVPVICTRSPRSSGCWCRRRDEELHGREAGRIVMNLQGGYTEIREPAHPTAPLAATAASGPAVTAPGPDDRS